MELQKGGSVIVHISIHLIWCQSGFRALIQASFTGTNDERQGSFRIPKRIILSPRGFEFNRKEAQPLILCLPLRPR
jgi:hypothetical protein